MGGLIDLSGDFAYTLAAFLVVLTVLVFVHELGHYLAARRCDIRVEVFSIGFGPEIWGFDDRHGTRWRLSWIPIGGYVKFFGDADAASMPGETGALNEAERAVAFPCKTVGQRAFVVVAGPLANLVFAAVVYAGLALSLGVAFTPPVVGEVQPDSAAAAAGLRSGDRVLSAGGSSIERFQDLQRVVRLRPGETLAFEIEREGTRRSLTATIGRRTLVDRWGNKSDIGLLGISQAGVEIRRLGPVAALWHGAMETWHTGGAIMTAIGQMFAGTRPLDELGGPLRIAHISGEMAKSGFAALVAFVGYMSVSLGLINLFPVPLLDGGHLAAYAIEAVRGRALSLRAQEIAARIGLGLVLALFVLGTWNDRYVLRLIADALGSLFS
ncbi:MAG: RIP metalloprotease RseP [Alphaproteobacteria bacterium]|nr:RIP metalloprotease RseP [Alphaproteobacteria bacterium]